MKKDIKFSTRMASADREAIKELAKRLRDVHERLCDGLLSGKAGGGH